MEARKSRTLSVGLIIFGALLAIGCSSSEKKAQGPRGWRELDAGTFTIWVPLGWEGRRLQGIDSYVGEFVGDGVKLEFDFGAYSNPLAESDDPQYLVTYELIDGRNAKIVVPRTRGRGTTGVYFEHATYRDKFNVYGQNLASVQQELALKAFRTIRFKDRDPFSKSNGRDYP